jgi:WD40 repeat protein
VHEITGPDFESAYKDAGERAEAQGNRGHRADPVLNAKQDALAQSIFKIWGATTEIAFSPDGTLLAATGPADPEAAVRLYDVASGTLKVTAIGTEVNVMGGGGGMQVGSEALQFSANGQRVAQIAPSENIQIFESATGALQRVLTTYQTKTILLTKDGRLLISGHRDGSLAFWCVASGQLVVALSSGAPLTIRV